MISWFFHMHLHYPHYDPLLLLPAQQQKRMRVICCCLADCCSKKRETLENTDPVTKKATTPILLFLCPEGELGLSKLKCSDVLNFFFLFLLEGSRLQCDSLSLQEVRLCMNPGQILTHISHLFHITACAR